MVGCTLRVVITIYTLDKVGLGDFKVTLPAAKDKTRTTFTWPVHMRAHVPTHMHAAHTRMSTLRTLARTQVVRVVTEDGRHYNGLLSAEDMQ